MQKLQSTPQVPGFPRLASAGAADTATVGSYDVTPSTAIGSGLTNYAISYVTGTLSVGTKALTITADARSKTYGATLTLGTSAFTTDGLVNGDTQSNFTTAPTCTTDYTVLDNVGQTPATRCTANPP